jgi:hypothetical protein
MLSVALLPLFVTAALPAPGAVVPDAALAEPPVRVSLDRRNYQRGDRAHVTVRVRDDGYLVVLQLSADGYVRVLFPLDPGDDDFVRGAQSYEILGRGDREAFSVDAASGTGTVYAAWSREPFRFDDFVRGDHWDYRVLWDSALPRNPEAGLTNIIQRMSTARFDYDLQSYYVQQQVATAPMYYPVPYAAPFASCAFGAWYDPWCGGYYPYYGPGSGFGVSITFGSPFRRIYRPRFYDPFFYGPFYYGPYYYGFPSCYYCGPRVVVVNRPRYPGFYGYPVRTAPLRWKSGSPGGGGVVGVHYRPRSTFASATTRPVSPVSLGSRFRIAQEQPALSAPRRGTGSAGATPRASTYTGATTRSPAPGGRRAVEQEAGVVRATPRRAEPATIGGSTGEGRGTSPGARRVPTRVEEGGAGLRVISPRDVQRRAEPVVATPRPSEPRAAQPPRSVEPGSAQPRGTARRAEPPVATPRPVMPARSAPRAAPREAEPRAAAPVQAQPRPAQPGARVVAPSRAQPPASERSYDPPARSSDASPRPMPRAAEPARAAPRAAPAPQAAPAPRATQPRVSRPRGQQASPPQPRGEVRGRETRD